MINSKFLLCILIAFSFLAFSPSMKTPSQPAFAGENENVELVGHIGGEVSSVFVQSAYAYLSIGSELAILDISDPHNPSRIGYIVFPHRVQDVYVAGNYAFVAFAGYMQPGGLGVVDVSYPAAPIEISFVEISAFPVQVTVQGNYAYLVCGQAGLRVIDISDLHAPAEVGLYDTPGDALNVTVSGGYAYVSDFGGGLRILDISDPASPKEVGVYISPWDVRDTELIGNYAYILDIYSGLFVVDISNPTNPMEITNFNTPDPAVDLAIGETFAFYISGGYLTTVDISNPANPKAIANFKLDNPGQLALAGDYVYVSCSPGTLWILDITNPVPKTVGSYRLPASNNVVVTGEFAYLLDYSTLSIFNISHPKDPVLVSFYMSQYEHWTVLEAANGYVYPAGNNLIAIDVSDPHNPRRTGSLYLNGEAKDIVLKDPYAYIMVQDEQYGKSGMKIVDLSDPAHPKQAGFFQTLSTEGGIAIREDTALIVDAYGLHVLDITDPIHPQEVDSFPLQGCNRIAWRGDFAYVTTGSTSSLRVLKIPPSGPIYEVGYYDTKAYAHDVELGGNHAFVVNRGLWYPTTYLPGGLQVIDISDPENPTREGFYTLESWEINATLAGSYAFVAGGSNGFFILRFGSYVSGRVSDAFGLPFPGVTISAGEGLTSTTEVNGAYELANLDAGGYTLTPNQAGYVFYPPSRSVVLPPHAPAQDFVILPAPTSAQIPPGEPASLVYTDTLGLPTRLEFPVNTSNITVTISLTPTLTTSGGGFLFTGNAFVWEMNPGVSLTSPVTVTIHYSQSGIREVWDESQLTLWWWTGSAWVNAASTCEPPVIYSRDMVNNVISIPVCQPGKFALFGPTFQAYLPLTRK